jgi:hypothetical protein
MSLFQPPNNRVTLKSISFIFMLKLKLLNNPSKFCMEFTINDTLAKANVLLGLLDGVLPMLKVSNVDAPKVATLMGTAKFFEEADGGGGGGVVVEAAVVAITGGGTVEVVVGGGGLVLVEVVVGGGGVVLVDIVVGGGGVVLVVAVVGGGAAVVAVVVVGGGAVVLVVVVVGGGAVVLVVVVVGGGAVVLVVAVVGGGAAVVAVVVVGGGSPEGATNTHVQFRNARHGEINKKSTTLVRQCLFVGPRCIFNKNEYQTPWFISIESM